MVVPPGRDRPVLLRLEQRLAQRLRERQRQRRGHHPDPLMEPEALAELGGPRGCHEDGELRLVRLLILLELVDPRLRPVDGVLRLPDDPSAGGAGGKPHLLEHIGAALSLLHLRDPVVRERFGQLPFELELERLAVELGGALLELAGEVFVRALGVLELLLELPQAQQVTFGGLCLGALGDLAAFGGETALGFELERLRPIRELPLLAVEIGLPGAQLGDLRVAGGEIRGEAFGPLLRRLGGPARLRLQPLREPSLALSGLGPGQVELLAQRRDGAVVLPRELAPRFGGRLLPQLFGEPAALPLRGLGVALDHVSGDPLGEREDLPAAGAGDGGVGGQGQGTGHVASRAR